MDLSRIALFFIGVVGLLFFWIHHDSSVVLPLEYFDMTILSFGLFVGYCCDLDYSLIVDIAISVSQLYFWG